MRSSTFTRAISGRQARSAKQPGRSKPMTGPRRHRSLRSVRHSGQSPQGSFARAATRSPGRNRLAPGPVSTTRAQNSCPNNWTGASVSRRRLMRSKASVGIPWASWASVTLGCTHRGSTRTWPGPQTGSGTSSSRRSLKPWKRQAFIVGSSASARGGGFLVRRFRQQQGDPRRGEEQEAGVKERQAVVADLGKEPEEYGTQAGGDAAEVVAEARARRAQQRGKQRGQVHREQGEHALQEADRHEPVPKVLVIEGRAVGRQHRQEIGQAEAGDGPPVPQPAGEQARQEVPRDGRRDDHPAG